MDPEKLAYESGCQGWFKGEYKKYFSQPTAQSSKSKVIQSLNKLETNASQAFHILLLFVFGDFTHTCKSQKNLHITRINAWR